MAEMENARSLRNMLCRYSVFCNVVGCTKWVTSFCFVVYKSENWFLNFSQINVSAFLTTFTHMFSAIGSSIPLTTLKGFRALKLSRLENFMDLHSIFQLLKIGNWLMLIKIDILTKGPLNKITYFMIYSWKNRQLHYMTRAILSLRLQPFYTNCVWMTG